ncbi:MAG: tRNA lysidine(34) synthetase TilS [Coxiella sp. (in: Bacteria)]|nr:MAG: tRNA lysidine(34) synthetase TilS [Coxiella sp. (in: g-proteobacteria)]
MLSIASFKQHLAQLTSSTHFLVAYSGGVDSHVLLHLMSQIEGVEVTAIHVNHGLNEAADQWQVHCQSVCDALDVSFREFTINVIKKPRQSLEAVARDMRYSVLEHLVKNDVVLVTGHNENDQAETVLLQLMRGAGVKGLSAMPMVKAFGQGQLMRPLLNVTRADIETYARTNALEWIEDSSNADDDFDRNFLRNQILPQLQTRREGVLPNLARSAQHIAEAADLIQEFAAMDYEVIKGDDPKRLNIELLKQLSDSRQSNVIRYWLGLQNRNVRMPSQAILEQIKQQLLFSYPGSHPVVQWGKVMLRREQGAMYVTCLS